VPSPILLIASDPATGAPIVEVLSKLGHVVTSVADPAEALGRVPEHELVIIDVPPGNPAGVALCSEIRADAAMASIPVMCVSGADDVEDRIRYLEAGADDVIARPFDDRELEARVEALQLRFRRTRDRAAPMVGHGGIASTVRTVAIFSPKGGVGTTTIATNVAIVAARQRPERVAILDLALPFGSVATHLNVAPAQTVADIVRDETALNEPEILRTYATPHESGLHVLAASPSPEMDGFVEPRHITQLIATCLGAYDALVIDAGSSLDERTMTVLDRVDSIVVPLYPEIAALKVVHAMLDFLSEAGSTPAKMTFVLNNAFAREILRLRDVESALATRVAIDLPYDPFVYLKAVNEGIPVVQGAPRSSAAESLTRLSGVVFGESAPTASNGATTKRSRLGGLLKR